MDVDATQARKVEDVLAEDLSVGDNDDHVGPERLKLLEFAGGREPRRLEHGRPELQSLELDGWGAKLEPAADRLVFLRVDPDQLGASRDRFEGWNREVRRPHENGAKHPQNPLCFLLRRGSRGDSSAS